MKRLNEGLTEIKKDGKMIQFRKHTVFSITQGRDISDIEVLVGFENEDEPRGKMTFSNDKDALRYARKFERSTSTRGIGSTSTSRT